MKKYNVFTKQKSVPPYIVEKAKKIINWQIIGIIFVILLGSFFHFIYQLSNNNPIVAFISPVNESVWEHLKLTFYPLIIISIIEYLFLRNELPKNYFNNFILAKLSIQLTSMLIIVSGFYIYTQFLEENLIIDISLFIISVIIGYFINYLILTSSSIEKKYRLAFFILFLSLIVIFSIFTLCPPRIDLFQDPESLSYGIEICQS